MKISQFAKNHNISAQELEKIMISVFGMMKPTLSTEDIEKIEKSGLLPKQKQLPESKPVDSGVKNLFPENNQVVDNDSELTPFEREMLSYMELGALEGQALSDAYHATKRQVIKNDYIKNINAGKEVRADKKAIAKGGSGFFACLHKQNDLPEYIDVDEVTEAPKQLSPLKRLMLMHEQERLNG